jgi:ectoine hydroxylase-related dioxygenase (phytanoyl-CoA dioxygenase family)
MSTLKEDFDRDGYIVAPALLGADEVAALNADAEATCASERLGPVPVAEVLAIHFPHKISALMRATMAHPAITRVLTEIIGPNVKCMQSMFFVKNAGKPGQAWHQDEAFIPTRDRSLCGGWIALDDATIENGCLWVVPGSHKPGVIWPMREHDDPEFDFAKQSYDFPYRDEDAVPVEVKAGSVVFFNGYLLHRSLKNRATRGFRRALVYHYMSAESLLPWTCGGRVESTQDNRDIALVAGEDPYAWKGLQDHHPVFLRRETAFVSTS